MRKMIVTAVAAFAMGGISTGVFLAQAQTAAPPPDGPRDGMMARGPGMGPGMGPGGPGMGDRMGERMGEHHGHHGDMMRVFALVPRAEDRKLTPPDVQKIAEAFLLFQGNHTWKVVNVANAGDVIGFDFATADGSVITHFTMDPKTGRLNRPG